MNKAVTVRAARAQDKNAILAFCQNTFSWGDYIAFVWDDWLADPRGKTFVGVVNSQPVGMLHVAVLREGAAWMEGLRVHPEYRRVGLASAMDAAGCAYARNHGIRVARLATARDNLIAQKTLEQLGYSCMARYGEWSARAVRGKMNSVAAERDLPQIYSRWRDVTCTTVGGTDWRWEKLDANSLSEIQAAGDLRAVPDGFAIFREHSDEDALILHALVGPDEAMQALARSARAESKYRGYARTEAMIVDDPKINRVLGRAGFKCTGGMLIYERAL